MAAPEPTAAAEATREEIAFFRANGFVAIPRCLTSPAELAQMQAAYDDVFGNHIGAEDGNYYDLGGPSVEGDSGSEPVLPQALHPEQYNPALRGAQLVANCSRLTELLMGEGCGFGATGHAILKPPRVGAETPWHQDEAYWTPEMEYNACSIWVPLQDVDAASGCLHFIPRSHQLEVLKHRHIGGDPRVHGLEIDQPFDLSTAVACPLPAGGCTVHMHRTMHYSAANKTDVVRRAYGKTNRGRTVIIFLSAA